MAVRWLRLRKTPHALRFWPHLRIFSTLQLSISDEMFLISNKIDIAHDRHEFTIETVTLCYLILS